MPTHSLKARALILCLAFFIPGTAIVHAGGQAEPRLADVERLIQRKDYGSALKLLVMIQRNDPNLRDETSRIMSQIMAVNEQFNAVLEEMNKAIEAGDEEKTQQLALELEDIDPFRSAGLRGQAQLLVGFLRLMNKAQALLREGKTAEALSTYLLPFVDPAKAGLTLPQAPFEAAGYGDIITAGVKRIRTGIVALSEQEVKAAPGIPGILPAAKALIERPPPADGTTENPAAATQFDALTAPILQAAAAEGTVRTGASFLAEMNQSIQRASDRNRQDPYVRYLVWIWLGRDNTSEGVAYALRQLWTGPAQSAADAANDGVAAAFESARSRYESGDLAGADAAFQDMPARSILAVKSAALASAQFGMSVGTGWQLPDTESGALKIGIGRALAAQEYAAEAAGYRLLISYRKDLGAMPATEGGFAATEGGFAAPKGGFAAPRGGFPPPTGGQPASPATEAAVLVAARTALNTRAAQARIQDSEWSARSKSWESKAEIVEEVAPLAEAASHLAALFRQFADEDLRARDLAYAIRIATLSGADFPKRLDSALALRTKAEDLKDGTVNGQVISGAGLAVKHPDQALQALSTAGGILDSLVTDIQAQGQQLQADADYVKSSPAVTALFDGTAGKPGYNAILQTARSEKARIETVAVAAQRSVDNAAISSREGDNNYAQALAALNKGDPDGAAIYLEQATAAYLKSMTEEYTDHAAAQTTQGADEINNRIVSLQNTISVANAQKAINVINGLITKKDFLGASDSLDAAVRAWNQNQDTTYPPFENLRLTIQAAVELSQGREISRLDAKADVVNAFIKNAQDNLAAGKLADATQNVKDALAVAPNYGAAKVLQLMIKKQTDPAGFQKDATAQIATYMSMGGDKNNLQGQKTAYLALLDYSKLDPKFAAQTRATIQELEYTLGVAQRPPTAQQIAQSNALVQQANLAQQQGTQEGYQNALDLLKQALKVNQGNADAVRLDGLIRTKMGSSALAALSAGDTQSYNQAYSLFLSGAYQDAYDRVMSIWGDARSPRNKTYGPLLRLKKRLEVQLNIS